jgi:prefoldin subunit 5
VWIEGRISKKNKVILPLASGFTSRQRREKLKIQDILKSNIKKYEKVITTSQSNIHSNTDTKYHLNHSMTVKIQSEREIIWQERKLTSIKQNFIKFDTSN